MFRNQTEKEESVKKTKQGWPLQPLKFIQLEGRGVLKKKNIIN